MVQLKRWTLRMERLLTDNGFFTIFNSVLFDLLDSWMTLICQLHAQEIRRKESTVWTWYSVCILLWLSLLTWTEGTSGLSIHWHYWISLHHSALPKWQWGPKHQRSQWLSTWAIGRHFYPQTSSLSLLSWLYSCPSNNTTTVQKFNTRAACAECEVSFALTMYWACFRGS